MQQTSTSCDPSCDPEVYAFLTACSTYYEQLLQQLNELNTLGRPEATLTWIEMLAGFAAQNHAGRFADGAVENIALTLGRELSPSKQKPPSPLSTCPPGETHKGRRVLHVATIGIGISGYMRMIINWVRKDRENRHSLILTRQDSTPIPPDLLEVIEESGGAIITFPATAPLLDRASWLRQLAPCYGDLAVLHLIPNDVVPIVAFAAETRIPIAQVNLADQCYWLGSTVADSTINLREVSRSINAPFRFTRNELMLPIPLRSPARLSRREARARLGISESECMLLTIGRAIKYTPSRRQSFFQTAIKILEANPQVHIYAIGVNANDHGRSRSFVNHDRMHFVGSLSDPGDYQRAADVYLEGFPFGSQTALLESVLPSVPCVRAVAPLSPVLAASDIAIEGIAPIPDNEAAYVDLANTYVSRPTERVELGRSLRERVLQFHVDGEWDATLADIYDRIDALRHVPEEISSTRPSMQTADLAISEYHGTRFVDVDSHRALESLVRRSIQGCAYSLRQHGAYADALRLVAMSNYKRWWWDRQSIAFAAKLVPHKLLRESGLLTVE